MLTSSIVALFTTLAPLGLTAPESVLRGTDPDQKNRPANDVGWIHLKVFSRLRFHFALEVRIPGDFMYSPPKWALDLAHISSNSLLACVEGTQASKWLASKLLLLVTADEFVCLSKGYFTLRVRRVAKSKVSCVGYNLGIEQDTIKVRISGADPSVIIIRIDRHHRTDAWEVLKELHTFE